jgi:hypothetical protein
MVDIRILLFVGALEMMSSVKRSKFAPRRARVTQKIWCRGQMAGKDTVGRVANVEESRLVEIVGNPRFEHIFSERGN